MSNTTEAPVILFRLSNGDEILGKADDQGNLYVMKDTVQLLRDMNEQGQMSMGMIDYLPYMKDNTFILSKASIVAFGMPVDSMVETYNQKFSKIVVPKKGIITK